MQIIDCKGKINVGDWVRTNGSDRGNQTAFFEGEIGEIRPDKFFVWQNSRSGVVGNISPSVRNYKCSWVIGFDNPSEIEIIKNNALSEGKKDGQKMKLNNMMKRLLDSDIKKLIKANLINGDLQLTDTGKEALNAILFEVNKAELVKIAEEIITEEKENK